MWSLKLDVYFSGSYLDNVHAPPGMNFIELTLVLKDKQPPVAHNIVFSATEPFFMKILNKNSQYFPFIYSMGIEGLRHCNLLNPSQSQNHATSNPHIESAQDRPTTTGLPSQLIHADM